MTRQDEMAETNGPRWTRPVRVRTGRPFGVSSALRVWAFTVFLSVTATVIYFVALHGRPGPVVFVHIPWPLLAIAVALAELKVVEVHFRRETHSFSLSEFPAVIGFFLLPPNEYMAAVLVGSTMALVLGSRQRPIKIAFNLANFGLVAVVSLTVLYAIADLDTTPDPRDWLAAFAATMSATVLSALTIATVITLSGGAPQYQKLPEMLRFGSMVALANTSLALLAVSILWLDPLLLWLLILPLVIVFVAYRAYVSEREKHERLELLYQSSRILQHSPELDSTLVALLGHARAMFRAELAEVILYPRSGAEALRTSSWHDGEPEVMVPLDGILEDPLFARVTAADGPFFHEPPRTDDPRVRHAMVSPLRGESELIGSILIANRLTEGTTFTEDDLRLLETLANQAAVALENGQLEQSLAELSRLKEQLRYQAYHDPLTGLANRSLFIERVDTLLADKASTGTPVVLFLDLDDFKVVNDTFGHAAGDRLLIDIADRLRGVLRTHDLAARFGGDEFAVLVEDEPDLRHATGIADRIIDALRMPFPVAGEETAIRASIGIAAGRRDTERAGDLLRDADVAMYRAKSSGKNRVAVFEPMMHAAIVARSQLSADLARSLGQGELMVHYQPIVDLQTSRVVLLEALVRWQHPTRGPVGPDAFIPIAEETGVILPLGRWVLAEACRAAAMLAASATTAPAPGVAVNLSAQQLQEATFVEDLRTILTETGLAPSALVLEMTETVLFRDTSTTLARLEAIRDLGVRIAIDDFGTGYSSLGYLRRFHVDILKIAREFLGPTETEEPWAFAAAIVALGRTLGLTVIAEGIEERRQLARLRELGCELGQGFLFSVPLDLAKITAKLEDPTAFQVDRPTLATGDGASAAGAVGPAMRRPGMVPGTTP